jgi:MFS transporter, YNFM family, putative membrane transport protein
VKASKEYHLYRIVIAMVLGSFILYSSLYWAQPLILLFSEKFNKSPATSSLVMSVTTISITFALLLAPFVTNNIGRKNTMVISLLLTSILTILSIALDHFYWLLFVRFLVGICVSGFLASVFTYLKEEVKSERLGRVVGIYIAGTALGGVLGRIISSLLIEYYKLEEVVMFIGGLTFIISLLFWLILPNSTNFEKRPYALSNLKNGFLSCLSTNKIRIIYISCFFTVGIYTSVLNYISYPLAEPPFSLSQAVIGFVYFLTLSGIFGSLVFGRLIGTIFDISLYRIGLLIMASGAILTTTNVLWLVFIGLFLFAFGIFASNTVASNWIANKAPLSHKAEATSVYSIFYYLGSSMIGWLSGYVFLIFGWSVFIFILSSVLILITFFLRKINNSTFEVEIKVKEFSQN